MEAKKTKKGPLAYVIIQLSPNIKKIIITCQEFNGVIKIVYYYKTIPELQSVKKVQFDTAHRGPEQLRM